VPLLQRWWVRAGIGLLLWGVALACVDTDLLVSRPWSPENWLLLSTHAVLLLAGLCATGLLLAIAAPHVAEETSRLALLGAIGILSALLSRGTLWLASLWATESPLLAPFLLPYALGPILATLLLGNRAGVAAGMWTTLAALLMLPPEQASLAGACGLVSTFVVASTVYRARTRSRVVRMALAAGVAQTIGVFAAAATDWASADAMAAVHQASACLFSGFVSAWVALFVLPLLESTFRVTSDITLLELTDLGHPVLQRLALEAPGTYHHSLIVANLASAAADACGANSLLTRVAAYFHDIGKLTKPAFFVENQDCSGNPHDKLPPSMSTLIITSHVKEGLTLAVRHKLPYEIQCIIREHHGTSVLSWFHHKAKTQLELELERPWAAGAAGRPQALSDAAFRYPGPRPTSCESIIVALADGVEAAARTLEKFSPASLEDLVDEIVLRKIQDGQFDDAPLTFSDLSRIRRSLVGSLSSMHHGRIPYPRDEDRPDEPAEAADDEPAEG
jgi:putative nucleotidyltransferase with HDIG domain